MAPEGIAPSTWSAGTVGPEGTVGRVGPEGAEG